MWISKQEYEEGGKQCVDRKCPWFIFFYSTATLIMFSSWTLWKGQHLLWFTSDPGLRNTSRLLSLLLYIFFVFLSTSTCMSMKHLSWVYCEHLQSELSCDEKIRELFFHLHLSIALKMIYWNQFSILTAIINTPTAVTISVYRLWHSFNDHVGATQCETLQSFCGVFWR